MIRPTKDHFILQLFLCLESPSKLFSFLSPVSTSKIFFFPSSCILYHLQNLFLSLLLYLVSPSKSFSFPPPVSCITFKIFFFASPLSHATFDYFVSFILCTLSTATTIFSSKSPYFFITRLYLLFFVFLH